MISIRFFEEKGCLKIFFAPAYIFLEKIKVLEAGTDMKGGVKFRKKSKK